jgi:hypothetical protein
VLIWRCGDVGMWKSDEMKQAVQKKKMKMKNPKK